MKELSMGVQTLCAEFLEQALISPVQTKFPLSGSFKKKHRGNKLYWYFQDSRKRPGGSQPTTYVGLDSAEVRQQIEEHNELKQTYKDRKEIVKSLKGAGLRGPDRETSKVLRAMVESGVFEMNTCLIGTMAFQTYSVLLGVRFGSPGMMTMDVDIAYTDSVRIGVANAADIPLEGLLKNVDPSYRPVNPAKSHHCPTRFKNSKGVSVDMLIPLVGVDTDDTPYVQPLGVHAEPLRFLDYLTKNPVDAVAMVGEGLAVKVPAPERFAIHKLLISQERKGPHKIKVKKDIKQASELIEVLADQNPEELGAVFIEAEERGPKWRKRLRAGVEKLSKDLQQTLNDCRDAFSQSHEEDQDL